VDWINLKQDEEEWRTLCERCNESSGSINCMEFLDRLQVSQILKKNAAPWC